MMQYQTNQHLVRRCKTNAHRTNRSRCNVSQNEDKNNFNTMQLISAAHLSGNTKQLSAVYFAFGIQNVCNGLCDYYEKTETKN